MKKWFQDDILQRLFKNASILLFSDFYGSVLRAICMILSARSLGSHDFGILVLIQAYVGIIDRLVNFQCEIAVIKYGTDLLNDGNRNSFKSLIKLTFILEVGTVIVGTATAIAIAPLVGSLLDWSDKTKTMAMIYCLIILFNFTGTYIGILRLFNNFSYIAWQRILSSSFKFIGILIVFFRNEGMIAFFVVWMLTTVIEYLLIIIFGIYTLVNERLINFYKIKLSHGNLIISKVLKFVIFTNLQGAVRMSSRELDTIVVGGILGAASAGLYKVVKQFTLLLTKISDPVYETIYPELAKLWAEKNIRQFKEIMLRSSLLIGSVGFIIWIIFILFGKPILEYTVGIDFLEAYPLLVLYMAAILIAIVGFPLTPAMLSMEKPHILLYFDVCSTIIYFCSLIYLMRLFSIEGAGIAYIVYYIIWSTLMILYIIIILEKSKKKYE